MSRAMRDMDSPFIVNDDNDNKLAHTRNVHVVVESRPSIYTYIFLHFYL